MPVLSFRADTALAKQLKEAARRDERCLSAFTRRIVREALEREKTQQPDAHAEDCALQPSAGQSA